MSDASPLTRRVDSGRGHKYLLDGKEADGVTTIISKGVAKPALIGWAANVTRDYAVDHWDELAQVAPSERIKRLSKARWADRERRRRPRHRDPPPRLRAGPRREVVFPPEELEGHVDCIPRVHQGLGSRGAVRRDDRRQPPHGYMGTLDLIARIDGTTWILDFKTTRSGIYSESALQLAAYAHCEFRLDADMVEHPMPEIERGACIWIRADGYDFVPVDISDDDLPQLPLRAADGALRRGRPLGVRPRGAAASGGGMSVDLYRQRSWLEVMVPAAELAKQIAGTEFVPKGLRNNPGGIAAAILFGDEVGFGPMQSLARIAVIDGKPALSAEAQRALILRAGHAIWIEEATTTKVTACGRRKDQDEVTRVTWTMDDAKRANLAGRPSWRMYPRQMLTARATAELARAVFADAIGGLAAIEELEDPADADVAAGNGADTAPRRTRRRSKTALAPHVSAAPAEVEPVVGPPLPGEEPEPVVTAVPPVQLVTEEDSFAKAAPDRAADQEPEPARRDAARGALHLDREPVERGRVDARRRLRADDRRARGARRAGAAALVAAARELEPRGGVGSDRPAGAARGERGEGRVSYDVPCAFCGEPVDAESKETWHTMRGWERPGRNGGSDIALRQRAGDEFAHDHCIRREQQRIPATQEVMFG